MSRLGSCRGLIGTPCDPKDPSSCVKNGECTKIQNHYNVDDQGYLCECKTGFIENSTQHCDIAHGFPCSMKGLSRDLSCDKGAGLECRIVLSKNGNVDENKVSILQELCSCPDLDDIYEKETRKCVKPLGISCL